ncbi:hypothetical protein SAMN05444170_1802 [Bradyrhizobium erythrophlei]|uniref:Uncharacterized protein n=1 Tax=Bradyrhizobium erythrophlei TaxID=1437360 RepID=A0A1M7TIZ0_9BRAD|nr:hypothetical protein SAMN05444170_1802 [Bradyrhizobium erythrophlei]
MCVSLHLDAVWRLWDFGVEASEGKAVLTLNERRKAVHHH